MKDKLELVYLFDAPIMGAAMSVVRDKQNRYMWKIGGRGIGGDTEYVPVPFTVPHSDFAANLANAYLKAIARTLGGGAYGYRVALKMLFNWEATSELQIRPTAA